MKREFKAINCPIHLTTMVVVECREDIESTLGGARVVSFTVEYQGVVCHCRFKGDGLKDDFLADEIKSEAASTCSQ